MTGHTRWTDIEHKSCPPCRRCGKRRRPMGVWCVACIRSVCCDRYPRLKRYGVFYDRWGKAWPAFRWTDCVHHRAEGVEL